MNGLEIAKAFYNDYFKDVIEKDFSDIKEYLAIGLVGSGSECFGYDDETSRDHDYEPGFCIFIPEDEIDSKRLFKLERAYYNLPNEYKGLKRDKLNPTLKERHGVISIDDFYISKVGNKNGNLNYRDWIAIPEYALAEATNGEIFIDNYGQFTSIRNSIKYYPVDIWLKKISGSLIMLSQAGIHNFHRCLKHGESGAAQLTIYEFVKHTINTIFLLNKTYQPFYKWSFKKLKELPILGELSDSLEYLISNDNSQENVKLKQEIINDIINIIISKSKEILDIPNESTLENLAFKANDKIEDIEIRNLNILIAV